MGRARIAGLMLRFCLALGLLTAGRSFAASTFLKDLSSSGNVVVKATAVHPTDGSVYVVGTFDGAPLTVGGKTLALAGGKPTGFIARMGSEGAWRWAGTLSDTNGIGTLTPRGVTVGANGNVFVCGDSLNGVSVAVQSTTTYTGSFSLPRTNSYLSPFVLNLTANGQFVWAAQASNNNDPDASDPRAYGNALSVNANGEVFLCGSFRSGSIADFATLATATGLNFGTNHAFRARDPSGNGNILWDENKPNGGTDWNNVTRDGFVAKLSSGGTWRWVATGGGIEDGADGGFCGITVNDQSEVYVTGNIQAGDKSRQPLVWNARLNNNDWIYGPTYNPTFTFYWGSIVSVPDTALTAWVGKIFGAGVNEGNWARAIPPYGTDQGNSRALASNSRARSVVWTGGQVFTAFYQSVSNDVFVVRSPGDLSSVDKSAAIVGTSGINDVATGTSLSADGNSNIYLVGTFGAPQATFQSGGPTRFVTSGQAMFSASLSRDLNWQWVQQSTQLSSTDGTVPVWGLISGAVDPQTGRLFMSGSFTNGVLALGPSASASLLPDDGTQQDGNARSFVGVFLPNGDFLQQVTFTLATEFGGDQAQPPQTPQTVLAGTTLTASVPPVLYEDAQGRPIAPDDAVSVAANAVARHTCMGYEIAGTALAGNTPTYTFTITGDTELRFRWKTEYALDIRNNLAGSQGGLTSTAAGNPDPVVQKHWVPAGTITTAFIDGVIPSPNPNEYGTRYRSTGYDASGSVAGFNGALAFNNAPGRNLSAIAGGVDLANRSYTIEFWARDDLAGTGQYLFSYGTPGGSPVNQMSMVTWGTNNEWLVHFSDSDLLVPRPVDRQWHHHAMVYDSAAKTGSYYRDGQLVSTLDRVAAASSAGNFTIANWLNPDWYFGFNGALDEIRLWSTNRSPAEIRANRNRALVGNEPGLQDYWRLDETAGTVLADSAPGGRDAVLYGTDAKGLTTPLATRFYTWDSVQSRQQVPQFLMNSPAVIEYQWVKENRLQVSAVPAVLANVPLATGGGVTNTGSGEFWFTNGAPVRISAPETASAGAEDYQIKGFISGVGNVTTVTGDGTSANGWRYYDIPALTQGSAITWDYSDRVYKGTVFIGNAIDFSAGGTFAGKEAIPDTAKLDPSNPPVATTIVADAPPGSTVDDMRVWDDVDNKLYPLRPGVILLEWGRQSGAASTRSIFTQITVAFPTNANFVHIANTPPVPLDSNKTNAVTFLALKYSQSDKAQVNDAAGFSVSDTAFTDPFWTVLLFSERPDGTPANGDLTRERLRVRTVLTKKWDHGLQFASAMIGTPITSGLHDATVPHTGYVYFEKARYNPGLYDRTTLQGPIIPVNANPAAQLDENLVVVWYHTQEGIDWPYQAVQYAPQWPTSANRIVVASRLGSEGLDSADNPQPSFEPSRYASVSVYNQPDRSLPGYNPNEEHAFVAASLLHAAHANPPPAAYALRNDLNVTSATDGYTSEPYVLVQYFDNTTTNWNMAVYKVLMQDPAIPARRLEFPVNQTTAWTVSLGPSNVVQFGYPADGFPPMGLSTNEVVDLEPNGNLAGLIGGRYRVSVLTSGSPAKFVLVPVEGGAPLTAAAIVTNENPNVVLNRAFPYTFEYHMRAGEPVQPPYPLGQIIGASPCSATTGENLDPNQLVYWEDHNHQPWAISGTTNEAAGLRVRFYYPLQPEFWHPTLSAGACVPYVYSQSPIWVTNHVSWPSDVPALKAGETLTFSGGEVNRDNPNAPGVPGVVGWAAGRIVYDDANPSMNPSRTISSYLARLASPLLTLSVPLPIDTVPAALQPAAGNVTVNGTEWSFKDLDASLQPRVFYDQSSQRLGVRGFLNGKTLGDASLTAAPDSLTVLQPNVLTPRDRNALVSLAASPAVTWVGAVSNLVRLSRDPQGAVNGGYGVGLAPGSSNGTAMPATQFGPGLALFPNAGLLDTAANLSGGYVTLAENDDPSLGAAPVTLHIVKILKQPLFRGAIQAIPPPNPFDEKITLRHAGDFGANAGDLYFQWYYRPDDGAAVPPPDLAAANVWSLFADPTGNDGRGMSEINLAGAGAVTLSDNRFFVRWRHASSPTGWSQWAGAANSRPPGTNELAQNTYVPQLAEGWIKRVTGAINPFEARIQDFRNNNTPATYVSMVQQAGSPYQGPVALTADPNVVQNVGLIELYTTVMERAKDLSIDLSTPVSTPAVNNSILLAASRIADLYLLLGNEAFTDAEDPTIGFGTSSSEYGSLAPTIFCFQNQVSSLLEEELTLLRGRSEEGAYPAYNRLLWNFTRGEGEAAYALAYNIADQNQDGFLNETDARIMYPQGHGDAWGHYLSAQRTYYDLLRHPYFNWQPRAETLSIQGVVVNVDYLDERKFAQAAAAKARAGAELVNLTYRSKYVEDPDGQWQGYGDTDTNRAWGVTGWARRAGCGALYDWITANAILPDRDPEHAGIEKVDRTTVAELPEIAAEAVAIRQRLDDANAGLNPLGLATDVVPFDIDPTFLEVGSGTQGETHFDQVYDRALKAMQNATDVFDHANQLKHMLRQVANTAQQFAEDAAEQDIDFRNRLIEILGTPYEGTIGPGKAYPAGYTGPDLYLYMYVDVNKVSEQTLPPPSTTLTAFFDPIKTGFIKDSTGEADNITDAFSHYFGSDVRLSGVASTDFSQVLQIDMPQTAADYSFQAPAEWGQRRAPGEIQQVLSELVQAQADLDLAIADYAGNLAAIQDLLNLIKAQSGLGAETIRLAEQGRDTTIGLNTAIFTARSVAASFNMSADQASDTGNVAAEALPKVVGLASDAFSTIRSVIKGGSTVAKFALQTTAMVSERAADFLEGTKEITQLQQDIDIQTAGFKYALQEQLTELNGMLGNEAPKRIEVFRRQEALRQISDKYRALLESGLRLMEERELHNKLSAGATQQSRYQDFTFRVARNAALSKYRSAFELAARYLYLAAKAYDYETNLDPNDPASAQPILAQIVHAQTLGAMDNGAPRLGSGGLADALAKLRVNFDALKSQMGFNNPQTESGRFSLRDELFRILPGPMINGQRDESTNRVNYAGQTMTAAEAWIASDEKWRAALQSTSDGAWTSRAVPDLWQVPEFRRYCRPFAPQSAGPQPGLVITFGSEIVFGKNFFGWPLGPGDSSYDPSHFATKVRSVGLWFENYNGEGLSATPRAYLIPTGLDIMLVPSSTSLSTREWNVVDQQIPVPLPVSQSNLNDPNWIPQHDSLNGTLADLRQYSMFRAHHDAGFTTDEMTSDSRLIGRSVWNTRWMLIIPGGTLLADGQEGLDTFLRGRVVPGSNPPARDGNGVKDIKLFFQTYAYSGN